MGRPQTNEARRLATGELGNGLFAVKHYEDALPVQEAELSMARRLGESGRNLLTAQGNLACTYQSLGRLEEALQMRRDVYSGYLKLEGEEHRKSILTAYNYVLSLASLHRSEEAKALMRKTIPVARRVLGESDEVTLSMRKTYAVTLINAGATLDDIREAITTLEDIERIARHVVGGANPITMRIVALLRDARAVLRAREATPVVLILK